MPLHNPPIPLENHAGRPTPFGYGRTGAGVGFVCFLAGLPIILIGLGILNPQGQHAPRFVILAVGVLFALGGFLVFIRGLSDLQMQKKLKALLPVAPRDPWRWDNSWDSTGTSPNTLPGIAQYLGFGVFLAFFSVPFHWWAFRSGEGPWPVKLATLAMEVGTVAAFWAGIKRLLKLVLFGLHRLEFDRFPFFLGSRLSVRLDHPQKFSRCQSLAATLRCIQDADPVMTSDGSAMPSSQGYVHYDETQTLPIANLPFAGGPLSIQFDLPEGDYGNRLLDHPPRYWEMEIKGESPRMEFSAAYVLPVYDNPNLKQDFPTSGSAALASYAMSAEDRQTLNKLAGFACLSAFLFGLFILFASALTFHRYQLMSPANAWQMTRPWLITDVICWTVYVSLVIWQRKRSKRRPAD